MMKTWSMVAAMFLAVGCKDKWDKALGEMEGFKNEMCACKDKACTDGVKKKLHDWEEKMSKEFGKDEKPPEKLISKGDAIEKEMRECRKNVEKAAGSSKVKESIDKMTAFKDQMCACKDAACAQKVSDDMTKWGAEQAASADPVPEMDEASRKSFTESGDALGKCMTTAMAGGAAAPAADGSAAGSGGH